MRSDKVDFEAELGVVIGRPCKNVKPEEALSYVLGYVCANDEARDWQKEKGGGQFAAVRPLILFAPLVPCSHTDEIMDPSKLTIRSFVNEDKCRNLEHDMIFDVPTLISFLSGSTTLLRNPDSYRDPFGVGRREIPRVFGAW